MSKTTDRTMIAYWDRRLFSNTFTHHGQRRVVPGWCIKVQWRNTRKTLRLRATGREAAAREAMQLFRLLQAGGWEALSRARRGQAAGGETPSHGEEVPSLPPVGPRKYVSNQESGVMGQLFVRLCADGRSEHLALGTSEENAARSRALELRAELRLRGWDWMRLAHSREATVAVFWGSDPMACTYTTFLTRPASQGQEPRPPAGFKGWRVLVIEPDGAVRRALLEWLTQGAGVSRVEACPSAAEVQPREGWHLILVNREQPAAVLRDRFLAARVPLPRLYTHGVFPDSDAIFASFSGVGEGYFLRRVPPASLLEPLVPAFPDGPPPQDTEIERQIRRYLQGIFEPDARIQPNRPAEMTARELEILDLLCRGFVDKEVATELGISIWTVHSHLKRIFAKYGVRTRTEAVVRHLQK